MIYIFQLSCVCFVYRVYYIVRRK